MVSNLTFTMPKPNAKTLCGICKVKNSPDGNIGWFFCNCCRVWFHSLCCTIDSQEIFDKLKEKEMWVCPPCVINSNFSYLTSQVVRSITQNDNDEPADLVISNKISAINKLDSSAISSLIDLQLQRMWPTLVKQVSDEIKSDFSNKFAEIESRLNILEERSKDQEHFNRSKNLIFMNIPDGVDIYKSQNFIEVIASELQVPNFSANVIENISRFSKKDGDNYPAPVLVTFTSRILRNDFFKCYMAHLKTKNLSIKCFDVNYPDTYIFINEHLSKTSLRIFIKARKMKNDGFIAKVSIRNGNIVVTQQEAGKPKIIRKLSDLDNYADTSFKSAIMSSTVVDTSDALSKAIDVPVPLKNVNTVN